MSKLEYSFADSVLYIIDKKLKTFILIVSLLFIVSSILIIFSQRSFIEPTYYKYHFDIIQLDEDSNPDFVLFDKMNLIIQDSILTKARKRVSTSDPTGKTLFFSKIFDKDKLFLNFINHLKNPDILQIANENAKTNIEFVDFSEVTDNSALIKLLNYKSKLKSDKSENINNFLVILNREIGNRVTEAFRQLAFEFEENNSIILTDLITEYQENLSSKIQKSEIELKSQREELLTTIVELKQQRADLLGTLQELIYGNDNSLNFTLDINDLTSQYDVDSSIASITEYFDELEESNDNYLDNLKRYLDKLDKNSQAYLGNLILNEKINIAKFSNIEIIKVKSNINFIVIRSIFIGLFISILMTFFYYLFIFGISRNRL